ncbi:2,3-diaminopropionate biosynthesis protein SbnB [Desulfobacterales bacterium HSG2]|nr:2,3-diaminopropionate biosynthesis protein SbnB [Desulfobacterales bacterium HSG2]
MNKKDITLLSGNEILQLFEGRELEIIEAVKSAYIIHARGESSLPHSSFLRFPDNERDRIIALPAYLGGEFNLAGIKWISSFPGNLEKKLERASAVLLLNSTLTGRLEAILESSVISSSRTAASAALAAHHLLGDKLADRVGLIGCGLINFETLRFLMAIRPEIESVFIHDLSPERAEQFMNKCSRLSAKIKISVLKDPAAVFSEASVTAFATTAIKPHIFDISECTPDKVILHTSLRDLSPEIILSADNIVDDTDHICRAQTSVHLAEQKSGNRNFIRCTLADILNRTAPQRQPEKVSVFSPFGLGVLDLAVGKLACTLAVAENVGTSIESFFPTPWTER